MTLELLFRLKLFGKVSFIIAQLKLASCRYNQDSPRTCERMNETKKIENPAGEPNNERENDMKHHQDAEDVKSEEKMLDAGSHTDLLATLSNCCNSRETSSNVSTLNLGKFAYRKLSSFF